MPSYDYWAVGLGKLRVGMVLGGDLGSNSRLEHFIMKCSKETRLPGRIYQYPPLEKYNIYKSVHAVSLLIFVADL